MAAKLDDRVIGMIYDAALQDALWPAALVALAEAMDARQSTLEVRDPYTGHARRLAPLCDPEFRKSFVDYYGRFNPVTNEVRRIPVGKSFQTDRLIADMEAFRRGAYFNEWWRPQGVAGGSLLINLIVDGRTTALATVHPAADKRFTADEIAIFERYGLHLTRAVTVQRRLQLAATSGCGAAPVPPDFVIVDAKGGVLDGGIAALRGLSDAGILVPDGAEGRVESRDGALSTSIDQAAARGKGVTLELTDAAGAPLQLIVMPCRERDASEQLIAIDRPAAILTLIRSAEQEKARQDRIAASYGLTPAEARVAFEIARGDGRVAAARRLGISDKTVRSHLSTVFDKMGVHRQAEVARLVLTA